MNVIIRDYRAGDSAQAVEVFRDSMNTLRKSEGGLHPDKTVDKLVDKPDSEILKLIRWRSLVVVAEVQETGEIVGIGAITKGWRDSLFKTTHSRNHFVKKNFQKGKAGVSVGTMLRKATIQKAASLGFRKIYGYSTPEAIGFHKKFGFKPCPAYNRYNPDNGVVLQYYELELRKSIWNGLRIEPYLTDISSFCGRFFASFKHPHA